MTLFATMTPRRFLAALPAAALLCTLAAPPAGAIPLDKLTGGGVISPPPL